MIEDQFAYFFVEIYSGNIASCPLKHYKKYFNKTLPLQGKVFSLKTETCFACAFACACAVYTYTHTQTFQFNHQSFLSKVKMTN